MCEKAKIRSGLYRAAGFGFAGSATAPFNAGAIVNPDGSDRVLEVTSIQVLFTEETINSFGIPLHLYKGKITPTTISGAPGKAPSYSKQYPDSFPLPGCIRQRGATGIVLSSSATDAGTSTSIPFNVAAPYGELICKTASGYLWTAAGHAPFVDKELLLPGPVFIGPGEGLVLQAPTANGVGAASAYPNYAWRVWTLAEFDECFGESPRKAAEPF